MVPVPKAGTSRGVGMRGGPAIAGPPRVGEPDMQKFRNSLRHPPISQYVDI
jgi:hypothetical protein